MTTIALKADRPSSTRTNWTGFVASFSDFCAGARDGQDIEARYRQLSRMSDPDLSDIGLSRTDIYRAALIGRPV